jgi:hypothetical protein
MLFGLISNFVFVMSNLHIFLTLYVSIYLITFSIFIMLPIEQLIGRLTWIILILTLLMAPMLPILKILS